jgi:hypothetical protein
MAKAIATSPSLRSELRSLPREHKIASTPASSQGNFLLRPQSPADALFLRIVAPSPNQLQSIGSPNQKALLPVHLIAAALAQICPDDALN